MLKSREKIILNVIIVVCFSILPIKVFADWEATLKTHFDRVETFDNLQDWSPKSSAGDDSTPADQPKKSDGSASQWGYFSNWGSWSGGKAIADFGSGTKIGSTGKSFKEDLGPSGRLAMYWGGGSAISGYEEVYVFYRMYLYPNNFPTTVNGSSYQYTAGSPYCWFASWKVNNLSYGFTGPGQGDYPNGGTLQYGPQWFVPHIKRYGYSPRAGMLTFSLESGPYYNIDDSTGNGWAALDSTPITTGAWIAIEEHVKLNTTANNGVYELWLYDTSGTPHLQYQNTSMGIRDNSTWPNQKINRFTIGGNISNQSFGTGMQSWYYVDDVIINGSRIGPTYYNLLNGVVDTTPPQAPTNVTLQIIP
jgi:hypothetical protein